MLSGRGSPFNGVLSKHYSLLARSVLAPLIPAVILTFNHRPHRIRDNDYEGSSPSNSLLLPGHVGSLYFPESLQ